MIIGRKQSDALEIADEASSDYRQLGPDPAPETPAYLPSESTPAQYPGAGADALPVATWDRHVDGTMPHGWPVQFLSVVMPTGRRSAIAAIRYAEKPRKRSHGAAVPVFVWEVSFRQDVDVRGRADSEAEAVGLVAHHLAGLVRIEGPAPSRVK